MRSLPLFHRLQGRPVIVLGHGPAAEPKRRLVERAGGLVIASLEDGLRSGTRLAFVALEDEQEREAACEELRAAGILVNVVDRPELCDFTTPSLLERDPVLIAIGTSGASAGLAKQLRLRLEQLLPPNIGVLAQKLADMREVVRRRWPDPTERRHALDTALTDGGTLDLLDSESAARVDDWLESDSASQGAREITLHIASDDPDDLTLRQARLLGTADTVLHDAGISPEILVRARADALRAVLPADTPKTGLTLILQRV